MHARHRPGTLESQVHTTLTAFKIAWILRKYHAGMHLQSKSREKQRRKGLVKKLEFPKLNLPISLDAELVECYFRVSGWALDGVDIVEHVDEHTHLLLLDVAVFFAVEYEKAELEDIFLLKEAVSRDGMEPFRHRQLLKIPDTFVFDFANETQAAQTGCFTRLT